MTKSSTVPSGIKPGARKRAAAFTTATVVSFSLTLFAGGVAMLAGLLPLRALTSMERSDIGMVLLHGSRATMDI